MKFKRCEIVDFTMIVTVSFSFFMKLSACKNKATIYNSQNKVKLFYSI